MSSFCFAQSPRPNNRNYRGKKRCPKLDCTRFTGARVKYIPKTLAPTARKVVLCNFTTPAFCCFSRGHKRSKLSSLFTGYTHYRPPGI